MQSRIDLKAGSVILSAGMSLGIRQHFSAALQMLAYDVVSSDGQDAVWEALHQQSPHFLLIFLSGPEEVAFIQHIREAAPGKPLVILGVLDDKAGEFHEDLLCAPVDGIIVDPTITAQSLALHLSLARRHADLRTRGQDTDAALAESEMRYRAILNTTVDGIITVDERGCIESFNHAAEKIFGYRAEEVLGKNVHILMPSPYMEEHDGYIQNYLDTGHKKIIGIGREVSGRRKDGSVFPMDLAVSEMVLGGRPVFTGVVRDITERVRLEQEILRISEQERRRIGQDLHDGLGQMLTGIGLITQNLTRTLEEEDAAAATKLAEITQLIKEADQQARGLARGLMPVDLEASGLASALRRLAVNAERLFGIRCSFEEVGSVLVEDNSVATHLYRIAQEAVSNAVKHGRATFVKVSLAAGRGQFRLRIQDDGQGFPEALDEETRGMGVRIMQYRARIIGANLDIANSLDGGAMITCTLRRLPETVARAKHAW